MAKKYVILLIIVYISSFLFAQNEAQLQELAELFRVDVEYAPTDTYLDYLNERSSETRKMVLLKIGEI